MFFFLFFYGNTQFYISNSCNSVYNFQTFTYVNTPFQIYP